MERRLIIFDRLKKIDSAIDLSDFKTGKKVLFFPSINDTGLLF